MGAWKKNKVESSQINGGQEYTKNSNPSLEQLNAITNNSFYAVEKADEALEKANSAFENNGTIVNVSGNNVATLRFSSDPQTQLDEKASQQKMDFVLESIEYLQTKKASQSDFENLVDTVGNKANKDFSNATFPQLTQLWSGNQTTTGSINLSQSVSNFRFICLQVYNSQNSENMPYIIPTIMFTSGVSYNINLNDADTFRYIIIKNNGIDGINVTSCVNMGIKNIYGIK